MLQSSLSVEQQFQLQVHTYPKINALTQSACQKILRRIMRNFAISKNLTPGCGDFITTQENVVREYIDSASEDNLSDSDKLRLALAQVLLDERCFIPPEIRSRIKTLL